MRSTSGSEGDASPASDDAAGSMVFITAGSAFDSAERPDFLGDIQCGLRRCSLYRTEILEGCYRSQTLARVALRKRAADSGYNSATDFNMNVNKLVEIEFNEKLS